MKIPCLACAVAIVTATAANAQSVWEGPYAGTSFAIFGGEHAYDSVFSNNEFELQGRVFGAFAGYNMSADRFIVGGELSVFAGAVNEEGFENQYEYTSFVDLKGRIGLVSGDVMPYAVLGASFGTFSVDDAIQPNRNFDQTETGILIGIGADYAVNDRFRFGAEFVSRSFDFEFPIETDLADIDGRVNSFALRGSYSF